MDYSKLFDSIRAHPSGYGLDGSFRNYYAFIEGLNFGNNARLLVGFREFLVAQLSRDHDNVGTLGLLEYVAFEGDRPRQGPDHDDPDTNAMLVTTLFDQLGAYFEKSDNRLGVVDIFREYSAVMDAPRNAPSSDSSA